MGYRLLWGVDYRQYPEVTTTDAPLRLLCGVRDNGSVEHGESVYLIAALTPRDV